MRLPPESGRSPAARPSRALRPPRGTSGLCGGSADESRSRARARRSPEVRRPGGRECRAWSRRRSLARSDSPEREPEAAVGTRASSARERPQPAIPRETDHFHLAVEARAAPFGDAPRRGILWKNGRDRVRPPQNVARVVANATRRFGRETLAPDGGVERVAELTFECQRETRGRLFAPEPSSANPVSSFFPTGPRAVLKALHGRGSR